MKAKFLIGLAAVAFVLAVRFRPRDNEALDAYLDYEEWPLFQ